MRLKTLRVAGFRGFNQEESLDFDSKLTLISAPNSHGKTSISEALEFILFGYTSKVEHADSKDEYKDSYRNKHYPSDKPAYIEAVFSAEPDKEVMLRVEMGSTGGIKKFLDGAEVTLWPFQGELDAAANPFILQHALKYLLLVAPTERFQGFARLLGLNEVDAIQQAMVNLCTKPEASVPQEANGLLIDLRNFEARLDGFPDLKKGVKNLKQGPTGIKAAYEIFELRADKLLGAKCDPSERVAGLVQKRDEATSKIYSGTVALKQFNATELAELGKTQITLSGTINESFINNYTALSGKHTVDRLRQEAQLLDLGARLVNEETNTCPLCGQGLNESVRKHISERHQELKSKVGELADAGSLEDQLSRDLENLKSAAARFHARMEERSSGLLQATSTANSQKVKDLFGKENETTWLVVQSAADSITPLLAKAKESFERLDKELILCKESITNRTEATEVIGNLGNDLNAYLASENKYASQMDSLEASLVGPSRLLQQAIDKLAGTAELSILIEAFEKKAATSKAIKIRNVLDGLKELKKNVEQTVGETMENAINTDLTGSVQDWYDKIKTTGDPNVHFAGFAMEKTQSGTFKSRRVKIQAKSYGVELASAVSSLSESKLNALGLCVSIASALRSPGPFDFIVLDDPIQSWDDEHETQFIEVIRSLVEDKGRQIILLSHKNSWIKQVALRCRTLNGFEYEINGYTKDGPHIKIVEWSPVEQRLKEAETIANDPDASTVRLQQAEEEIRLATCQIASDLARSRLNRDRSPHSMNSKDVRAILNESGVLSNLTDRVISAFGTTDDAHHAPKNYQPNAERIRQYSGALRELMNFANGKR